MSLGRLGGLSVAVGVAGLLSLAGPLVLQAQQSSLSTRARNNTPLIAPAAASTSKASPSRTSETNVAALVDEYCLSCHDEDHEKGGLVLETIASDDVAQHPEVWEKVVRKLRARQMPPVGKRPAGRGAPTTRSSRSSKTSLDRAAAAHPDPGRTATLRRLTRTEYQNAVRDLLALDIDAASLLPADESSYGFDNVTVGDLSPTLLDRYVIGGGEDQPPGGRAARAARPAARPSGCRPTSPRKSTSTGCRSARAAARWSTTRSRTTANTRFQIRLTRDRNEHVEGLSEAARARAAARPRRGCSCSP